MTLLEQLKGLTRHSVIYSLSTFMGRALGFVLLPIYTDTAFIPTRSAYGDLVLVYVFISFMTIVFMFGMDAALLRYFFLGGYQRSDVYKTALVSVALNALALAGLIYLFSEQVAVLVLGEPDNHRFFHLAALILMLDSVGNLAYLVLRAEERSVAYSSLRALKFTLELSLNIVFVVVLRLEVMGILYANLIASLINLAVLIPFQAKYMRGKFSREVLVTLLKFALPILPNGLAQLAVEVSDKYLMRLLLDKETVATYAANYKFGSLLLLVVIAFRTAWQPFFLKIARDDNAKYVYAKVMTYFTLVGVMLVVMGSFFVEYVIRFPLGAGKTVIGQAYWGGMHIIPIILSSYLFYGIYTNLTVGIYIQKRSELMIIFTGLAAAINVGSNFYLMPHFGMIGAAFATLASYLVMAISIYIANQRIYPVRYEYGRILFLLLYLAGMLFILYALVPALWMRILLILATPVFFLITGFFRPSELQVLRGQLKRIRSRKPPRIKDQYSPENDN